MLLPKFLQTFFEDNGAKILIPEGVKESRMTWENNPKNRLKTISMYETPESGIMIKPAKNIGIKIINNRLFKNKKLKRAINIANKR